MNEAAENEAFFAGRIFVSGEQNGYRFLLWGTHSIQDASNGGMGFSQTIAEPAEGAFLCKIKQGWLLVAGAGHHNNFRHTFLDDSLEADNNAASISRLGVPTLSIDEGNALVCEERVGIFSVTGDEKLRIAALASFESWRKQSEDKKLHKNLDKKLLRAGVVNKPKAPRRDCKNSSVWKDYYVCMHAWFQEAADVLTKDYPSAAANASSDAERFLEGVNLIVNRTHPNIVSGKWR